MDKLRNLLIVLLQKIQGYLLKAYNDREFNAKVDIIRACLHQNLPHLDQRFSGKTIIEGGKFNYFQFPDGTLPVFHFVVPELFLLIYVGGIDSATWEEARLRGVKRAVWERTQAHLTTLEVTVPYLEIVGSKEKVKFLLIRWGDSISSEVFTSRVLKLLEGNDGS